MDRTIGLRRQAEFCLRLSQLCSDRPLSCHLSFLAARYHEIALRAEFGVPADGHALSDADDAPTALRLVRH